MIFKKGLHPVGGRGKDSVRKEVLRLLKEGYDRDGVCKALSITTQRFYAIRKELRNLGFLDSTFWPKEKGLQGSPDSPPLVQNYGVIPTEGFLRLHRVQLRFKVSRWLLDWAKLKGKWVQNALFKNNRYVVVRLGDGCVVKVYRRILDVYVPVLWGNGVRDVDAKFWDYVRMLVPRLESIGCRVKGEDLWGFGITRREYAWVENGFARHYDRRGEKVQVRDVSGELRFLVDKSTGLPEFESVHPVKSRSDMLAFESFCLDLVNNKWDLVKRGVGEHHAVLKDVVGRLKAYGLWDSPGVKKDEPKGDYFG